jgi:hypothetical protein
MKLDRALADSQLARDFFVGESAANQGRDLELARRHAFHSNILPLRRV